IRRDSKGRKMGSSAARNDLKNAIANENTVVVKDNAHGKSRVRLDENGNYTNEIGLDSLEIDSCMASSDLNPLTNDIGMVFFHELGHTPVGGGLHDPIGAGMDGDIYPGPNVRRVNQTRRQLGPSFGQRMIYNPVNITNQAQRKVYS